MLVMLVAFTDMQHNAAVTRQYEIQQCTVLYLLLLSPRILAVTQHGLEASARSLCTTSRMLLTNATEDA